MRLTPAHLIALPPPAKAHHFRSILAGVTLHCPRPPSRCQQYCTAPAPRHLAGVRLPPPHTVPLPSSARSLHLLPPPSSFHIAVTSAPVPLLLASSLVTAPPAHLLLLVSSSTLPAKASPPPESSPLLRRRHLPGVCLRFFAGVLPRHHFPRYTFPLRHPTSPPPSSLPPRRISSSSTKSSMLLRLRHLPGVCLRFLAGVRPPHRHPPRSISRLSGSPRPRSTPSFPLRRLFVVAIPGRLLAITGIPHPHRHLMVPGHPLLVHPRRPLIVAWPPLGPSATYLGRMFASPICCWPASPLPGHASPSIGRTMLCWTVMGPPRLFVVAALVVGMPRMLGYNFPAIAPVGKLSSTGISLLLLVVNV